MIETAYTINTRPSAVRFPRGSGYGRDKLVDILGSTELGANNEMPARGTVLEIGKGRIVKIGEVICFTILCHIVSNHIISYHTISNHIVSCHIISYHTILCQIILYRISLYRIIPYHIISYYIVSHHTKLYYIIP